ncbi:anthranilate synthase component I family protein [Microbacterium sp. No. 7]|uniref:anthranilate synthase component I family protein n=1 Tax=Microbacterium sp. No. 7 TaxID=1714373 RepID=UPI0006D1CAF5|nr:anthranilate synthase component I family protein [Microbacterium sp. No. 7]ALJ20528.1 metal ABC transporter ATP-binding protein [Microbacterium sp. No. 7]
MSAAREARRLPSWVDPAAAFLGGPAREPHAFWLDSGRDATGGWSWMGVGVPAPVPRHVVCETSAERRWGGFGGGWVGWCAYDDAAARAGAPARLDGPGDAGLAVAWFLAFDHARRETWVVAPAGELDDAVRRAEGWAASAPASAGAPAEGGPDGGLTAVARHDPRAYAALIERCRDAIRAGDAYQLCLTTRFEVPRSDAGEAVDAYLRLRAAHPTHHGGLVRVGDRVLLSASPERFLQIGGGTVRTSPIKGTRPRGTDPQDDARQARELLESVKERAENVMIVDLMRNDLQRVCAPGSVTVERLLHVESYPAVHQLVSTVAGALLPGVRIGDVLDAAFPAGSMTGAPKRSAMTILHRLEGAPRGVYAGCFGWIGDDGGADLAMVIRSIVYEADSVSVGAGGGITWRSEAAAEVAEVAVKARGPLAAIGARLPREWSDGVG